MIQITNSYVKGLKTLWIHAGSFHSDDVTVAALLTAINPAIKIKRVLRVPDDITNDNENIICDIGLGEFDHHQPEAEYRNDGVTKYAAIGKVVRNMMENSCLEDRGVRHEVVKAFDEKFIKLIDHTDNTGEQNPYSLWIKLFNPAWDETQSVDTAFNNAVMSARSIIRILFRCVSEEMFDDMLNMLIVYCEKRTDDRKQQLEESDERARQYIKESFDKSNPDIIVLEHFVPTDDIKIAEDFGAGKVKFIIYPSNREGYCIKATKKVVVTEEGPETTRESNTPFPDRWLGIPDEAKEEAEKLGLTFCHPGNWLASADTEEHAIAIAKIAIQEA